MQDELSMWRGLMETKAWSALIEQATGAVNSRITALRGKGDPWDYGYNSGVVAGMQGILSYPANRVQELENPPGDDAEVEIGEDD
jgi:hypothetical protein